MSEQTDKRLHDWVRQSLAAYQPAYAPADWARLQDHRHRRRWWQRGLWISMSIMLVSLLGWLWVRTITDRRTLAGLATSKPARLRPVPRSGSRASLRLPSSLSAVVVAQINHFRSGLPVHARLDPTVTRHGETSIPTLPLRSTLPSALTERINRGKPIAFSAEEAAIVHQMQTGEFGFDSTTYRVLERNIRQWPAAVVVCDMTTSMYPYTTQLVAWLKEQTTPKALQGFVFFTDCDSLGQQTRPGGPPGQMYISRDLEVASTLPLLLEAARNTVQNKDNAENTVEALVRAQAEFPQARHLILVADNLSQVKDMSLLKRLTKPVHVVLCGTTGSDTALAYQPDYYRLAAQNHGSLHTLEDDLNPSAVSPTQTLRVGTHFYRYSAGRKQFKLTPYTHRPKRYLGFLWL